MDARFIILSSIAFAMAAAEKIENKNGASQKVRVIQDPFFSQPYVHTV